MNISTENYTNICDNDFCGVELPRKLMQKVQKKAYQKPKAFKCPECGTQMTATKAKGQWTVERKKNGS